MYTATFYEPRQKCRFKFFQVRCPHKSGDVINFIIVACRISSRLKWYKNYTNRSRLAKVIVKNKMSRFYGSLCSSNAAFEKLLILQENQYECRRWLTSYLFTYLISISSKSTPGKKKNITIKSQIKPSCKLTHCLNHISNAGHTKTCLDSCNDVEHTTVLKLLWAYHNQCWTAVPQLLSRRFFW